MILVPQSVLRDCLAVFRRALPKPFLARSATPIYLIGGADGIRLRMQQPDIGVEYHHPSPSKRDSLTVPISALVDCEGRGNGTVQFQSLENGHVEVRWEQSGTPYQRDLSSREATAAPFPAWPARDIANDPSLLEALDEAMQIPAGGTGRLALNHIQLRGHQGDVVATDGRQLLIQGGFHFPWRESVLVSRTAIFGAREFPKVAVIRVAQSKTHVHIRIGGWTIVLAIDSTTRFPNVEGAIPNTDHPMTQWHVADDEALALAAALDDLPAADEEHAPVTLDLARPVAVRARAEGEQRCTEVLLSRSRTEGKALRIATDRRFLQRALKLGFRSFLITDSDKPIVCQDGQRRFVWVLLNPDTALAPQPHALRVILPAKGRLVAVASGKSQRPAPVPSATSERRVRAFEGFVNCARSLWNLVRKHHREEQVK